MTKIEFRTNISNRINYACRLIRKAVASVPDAPVVVCVAKGQPLDQFDEALWTFSSQDFISHARLGDANIDRVSTLLITCEESVVPGYQTLINLSDEVPKCYAKFDRLIELVAKEDVATQLGRQRYVYYKKRGYSISHEEVKDDSKYD